MPTQMTRDADPRRVQDMVPCYDISEDLLQEREDGAEDIQSAISRDRLYDEFVSDIACDIYGGLYKVDTKSDD